MFFTSALCVVFKTTGGRIWNKRWGLPRLTRTRKENRRTDIKLFNQNIDILKAAAHWQPDEPVRLAKPLALWQKDRMRRRLEAAQEQLNIRAAGPAVEQQMQQQQQWRQRQQRKQQELAGPPEDPQLQQRLNQQEVTRIKQRQLERYMRERQQQQKGQQGQAQTQQQQQKQQPQPQSHSK